MPANDIIFSLLQTVPPPPPPPPSPFLRFFFGSELSLEEVREGGGKEEEIPYHWQKDEGVLPCHQAKEPRPPYSAGAIMLQT